MGKRMIRVAVLATVALLALASCSDKADVVSENLSKDADNFEVNRRIVFFNGITDTYLMTIEGYCSIEADAADAQLEVVCKIGKDKYKKHFLGLSDNVSYFVEQVEARNVDAYHYKVIFKPEVIVPDIDLKTSGNDGNDDVGGDEVDEGGNSEGGGN